MTQEPNPHFDILVSGDLTINWYLARQAAGCARLNGEYGGAALLTRLSIKNKITSMNDRLSTAEKRASGRKDDGWN